MDLAEQSAFSHLDEASIRQAADRWLRPDEHAWCAAQPSFREAMVIVLSCKEAVYKAWGASGEVHELSLTMQGHGAKGRAVAVGMEPQVVALWEVSNGSILSLAAAAPAEWAWGLLERILGGGSRVRAVLGWRSIRYGPTRRLVTSDALLPHLARSRPRIDSANAVRQHAVPEPHRRHVSCKGLGQSATIIGSDDAAPTPPAEAKCSRRH
jgi:phosphopantetheinyl transferase (holo-ACP synthase)